jgi:hypothetical protein
MLLKLPVDLLDLATPAFAMRFSADFCLMNASRVPCRRPSTKLQKLDAHREEVQAALEQDRLPERGPGAPKALEARRVESGLLGVQHGHPDKDGDVGVWSVLEQRLGQVPSQQLIRGRAEEALRQSPDLRAGSAPVVDP